MSPSRAFGRLACLSILIAVTVASMARRPAWAMGEVGLSAPYPVVGFIERRGRVITLKAGPTGTLFSIETKEGRLLADNLDESQLKTKDPSLYELVRSALATGKGFIDASLGEKPGG